MNHVFIQRIVYGTTLYDPSAVMKRRTVMSVNMVKIYILKKHTGVGCNFFLQIQL